MTLVYSNADIVERERRIAEFAVIHYGLGACRRTSRLTGGVLNEVYLAESSRGDFVIRVNRVRRSIDEIDRLSDFLSHLDRSGIPVDGSPWSSMTNFCLCIDVSRKRFTLLPRT
jgi:Ser/Thr protein kinase RdoA (MazF antagonist)